MSLPKVPEDRFNDLLARNEEYLSSGAFKAPIPLSTARQLVQNYGYKGLYILTCADGRVHPEEIFGLKKGEANIIRNAGGTAIESDVFRSLSIMSTIAPIGMVVVLHHSDCGGLFTTDEAVSKELAERNPEHAKDVEGYFYGTYKHIGLDQSIKNDVQRIKAWPFLNEGAKVLGYTYEVETGKVRQVC